MALLSSQDRAMFAPVDRAIPGSVLTEYAESMCQRVAEETKRRLRYGVLDTALSHLVSVRGQLCLNPLQHEQDHPNPSVTAEVCVVCEVQLVIDLIMEATA